MKVQVKEGVGPIAGNYGLKNSGDIFNVPGRTGKTLEKAGLVTILNEEDSPEDETEKGHDMKRVNQRKEDKKAGKIQTKEEKQLGKTKEVEPEVPAETPEVNPETPVV